jgi:hypothetical protein
MTILIGCRLAEDAIMLADSRATWVGKGKMVTEDALAKILPLGARTALAYAGDVTAAGLIMQQLRKRITSTPRLRLLKKLAADVPRVARYYHRLYCAKAKRRADLLLMLGGVTDSGKPEIWWYQSPSFHTNHLTDGFIVLGSGEVAAPYIKANYQRIVALPDLKSRTDALVSGLEGELGRIGEGTVGGMFQVIALTSVGIRPYRYGFASLDQTAPSSRARSIDMKAGRWVQSNLATGAEVPLKEPATLVSGGPSELRFHDYAKPEGAPNWHLSYFLTCAHARINPDVLEFQGVFTAGAPVAYPLQIMIIASAGFWGTPGSHEVELALIHGGAPQVLCKKTIKIQYPVEDFNLAEPLEFTIDNPGPVFLELRVGSLLIGRRALYFSQPIEQLPTGNIEQAQIGPQIAEALLAKQRQCQDPLIEETGGSTLVYLSLCQNCIDQGTLLRFESPIAAIFWKAYPLKLRCFIAGGASNAEGRTSGTGGVC